MEIEEKNNSARVTRYKVLQAAMFSSNAVSAAEA